MNKDFNHYYTIVIFNLQSNSYILQRVLKLFLKAHPFSDSKDFMNINFSLEKICILLAALGCFRRTVISFNYSRKRFQSVINYLSESI